MSKKIKTHIQLKHDTAPNWHVSNYIPMRGEMIVYEADDMHSYPRLKVGDGVLAADGITKVGTVVRDLPFVSDSKVIVRFLGETLDPPVNITDRMSYHPMGMDGYTEYDLVAVGFGGESSGYSSSKILPLIQQEFDYFTYSITQRFECSQATGNDATAGIQIVYTYADSSMSGKPVSIVASKYETELQTKFTALDNSISNLNTRLAEEFATKDWVEDNTPDVYVSETAPQTTKVGSIWFDTSVVSTVQAEEAEF